MNTLKKILIVDDEPDILEFLSYNFSKKGFAVMTAANGAEGISRAIQGLPDVIISDIMMPEMDGVLMCKAIRGNDQFKDIPFIFLTAVNDDYKVLYAMSSGADQFVSKPVKFDSLYRMVNELMETKKVS